MSSISFVSPLTGAPLFPKLPLPSFPPGCRGSALIEGKASWPSSAAAPPPPQDPKPHAPAPLSITVPEELLHSFSSPLAAALLSFAGAPPKEKAALPAGVYVGHFDEACRYFGVPVAVESECATAEDAPLADVQDAANYLSAVESVGKSVEWWKGLVRSVGDLEAAAGDARARRGLGGGRRPEGRRGHLVQAHVHH